MNPRATELSRHRDADVFITLRTESMAQRSSGYARIADEQYETVPWPVHALLCHLPKPRCAWDPCDRGDGLLIDTLLRCKINAVGTEHYFLTISEPPMTP